MIYRFTIALCVLCIGVLVTACAGPSTGAVSTFAQAAPLRVEHGTVEAIEVYRRSDGQPVNVGTLLGGIAGGVIGHQIGGGHGNTVATIGGAIAGAVVGSEVEKRRVEGTRYRITVRLASGATLSVDEAAEVNLRVGDRVRVENNRVYRE
jgi:outer membrane lipoprotein SlyB